MVRVAHIKAVMLVGFLSIAALACSSDKAKVGIKQDCVLNTDCIDPLTCKFQKCHRACVESRDCDLGQRCVKVDGVGVCQFPEEKTCAESVSCRTPLVCSRDNQCRTNCTSQADCLASETCVLGTKQDGKVCTAADDPVGAAPDGGTSDGKAPDGGGSDGIGDAGGSGGSDAGGPDVPADGSPDDGGVDLAGTDAGPGTDAPAGQDTGAGTDVSDTGPEAGTYLPPAGPLVVTLTAASDPVAPKGRLLYTITVGNVSNKAVNAVAVSLVLPAGLQFRVGADAEPDPYCSGSFTCSSQTGVKWTLGALSAGASQTLVANAEVLETFGDGDAVNTSVTVSATGLNAVNVTNVVHILTRPSAQLTLGTAKDPLVAGETFSLDVDVGQLGTIPLSGTELHLSLPPGLKAAAVSDGGTKNAGEIVWTIGAVPVGGVLRRRADVTIDAAAPAGEVLVSRASLKFDGGNDVDVAAERSVSVIPVASALQMQVSISPNPVVPGERIFINAVVTNVSTRAVDGGSFMMRVPTGIQFSNGADSSPNAYCAGSFTCAATTEAAWTLGSIPSGASYRIAVDGQVPADMAGDGNLIQVLSRLDATGVNTLNSTKAVQVYSHPAAQLALGAAKGALLPSEAFSLDLDVGQIGGAILANTELKAYLPAGLVVGAISDGGTQTAPGEITWSLGALGVGAVAHRKVDVTMGAAVPAGTILTARSTLTYDGGAPVDASVEYAVTVLGAAPPLKFEVVATPQPVAPGQKLLYTATITNVSARAVDGIVATMRNATGTTFGAGPDAEPNAYCSGSFTCAAEAEATWDIGTLNAGMNAIITINDQVLASLLEGSLIRSQFSLSATGMPDLLSLQSTVAAHR